MYPKLPILLSLLLRLLLLCLFGTIQAEFLPTCKQHLFKYGGTKVVGKCSGKPDLLIDVGETVIRCSVADLRMCFAQENNKIFPKYDGGLQDVVECRMDNHTGKGRCLVWTDAVPMDNWVEFDAGETLVVNKNGFLSCLDGEYTAQGLDAINCWQEWNDHDWDPRSQRKT
ncbi:hypothetical protein MKZ38_005040 [Zalerion maritima]|uniref:Cyanovirin-N domain-containing protein n=1 Tax=Zalerion maritima TaxID=339359 RepID=A0AAD5WP72_9PEZI|nr:hypothetical protein MKZ38_005040 [Zalerion maritima]